MIRKIFAIFGVITVSFFLSFCAGVIDTPADDMPSGIWMTVPSTLDDGGSGMSPSVVDNTTNEGPAYEHIKSYVRAAKILCAYGDQIVTALRDNWTFMKNNKGTLVAINSNEWVFMNDQAGGGYFLYYGTNSAETNIYFDWTGTAGAYKGKLVLFLDGTNDTPIQAVGYYDQTLADRQLEIYAKYDGNGVWHITNVYVKLIEVSPGEIKVQAMAEYDRPYPMAWQLQGYGKINSDGGAIAFATGLSNNGSYYGTNYIYQEYFDSLGYTTWKMGNYDLYTNTGVLLIAGVTNAPDTYTGGTKPANIEGIITNIARLTDSDYPVLNLP
ncbi:MAG: hypothetical protein A2014_00630 [Spirochaetes bacterium GWF1_49_6]|nr:MAG: hypothetical protein A2014_00630 [Spirochaetes bacterium GWF1_49_6]